MNEATRPTRGFAFSLSALHLPPSRVAPPSPSPFDPSTDTEANGLILTWMLTRLPATGPTCAVHSPRFLRNKLSTITWIMAEGVERRGDAQCHARRQPRTIVLYNFLHSQSGFLSRRNNATPSLPFKLDGILHLYCGNPLFVSTLARLSGAYHSKSPRLENVQRCIL